MPQAPQAGEPFDPRPQECGFYPTDIVDRQRESAGGLNLTDGEKRMYSLLCRLAQKTGKCFASAAWLADALGKSERQVRYDRAALARVGLIHSQPHGRMASTYEFLFHRVFESNRQLVAGCDGDSNWQPIASCPANATGNPAHPNRRRMVAQPAMDGHTTGNPLPPNERLQQQELHERPSDAGFEFVRQALASYMLPPDQQGQEPEHLPDDSIVRQVLDAANGAKPDEVFQYLRRCYLGGQRPGTSSGPRSFAWFVAVVARHFGRRAGEAGGRRDEDLSAPPRIGSGRRGPGDLTRIDPDMLRDIAVGGGHG